MDYRSFLSRKESLVLPYFGGARVEAKDRRFRVHGEAEPGWWRFDIEGRRATPVEPAGPVDLSGCPAVKGHFACGWLFVSGREIERIALPPEDEPEPLAPCTGRRWYGGDLVLDTVEFEDDAEDQARRAFEDGASLAGIKGITPSLRAAFGFAVVTVASRAASIPVSLREVTSQVHAIAEGGRDAADALLERIVRRRRENEERQQQDTARRQRERAAQRVDEMIAVAWSKQPAHTPSHRRSDPAGRADAALEAAGARMTRCRRVARGQLEVAFSFMGERFISIVAADSLQVFDSGICLEGTDRELTLESLPSAIREAIDTGALYITRR